MTFTLLPDVTPFAIAFIAVAVLSVALTVGMLVTFFARNRAVRVRRRERLTTYYGRLAHPAH